MKKNFIYIAAAIGGILLSTNAVFAQKKVNHKFAAGFSYVATAPAASLGKYVDEETNDFLAFYLEYMPLLPLNDKVKIGPGIGLKNLVSFNTYGIEDGDNVTTSTFGYSSSGMSSYISVPVFAHLDVRFSEKRVSPFMGLSLGYNLTINTNKIKTYNQEEGTYPSYTTSLKSGVIANVHTGASFALRNGRRWMIGPFFEYQPTHVINTMLKEDYMTGQIGTKSTVKQTNYHLGVKAAFSL